MFPGTSLVLNLALAFYKAGTIWTRKLLGLATVHTVQDAHWYKLPYRVFAPVAAASVAVAFTFLLSCGPATSPFTASNATISIRLANSKGQISATTVSDTTGNTVHVKVTPYLYQYITTVSVFIGRSASDTDTLIALGNFNSPNDSLWLNIAFRTPGTRTITATAIIPGAPNYKATATIVIYPMPVRTFSLAYDGNGNSSGTPPADSGAYQQGAGVTIKGNTGGLVRTGYTFAGWNTAADGSGVSYSAGDVFTMTAGNVTLYAKWTQNPTYTVVYNGNNNTSGSAPTDPNSYEQNATVTVRANTGALVRTGYTFAGWNTAADGTGTSYAGGETFAIATSNVTLYAKWTQNPTYTVTYNGNNSTGGAVPTDPNAYEQGSTVTVKANTGSLVRADYTFAGWNTAADGTGAEYAGGASFSIGNANVVLYAVWTQDPTYTVTYNGNNNTSGNVPLDGNSYEQGASVTVKANGGNLAKTGYTFAGWNTAADGSGLTYAAGTSFNIGAANVILYAIWTQNPTFTVTYNGNGNTGGSAPTDANAYQQGASVTIKGNTGNLVKTGYTFAGWNTAADGSGTPFAAGATLTMGNANVSLYANWTQNPTYTVTYMGNGNTSGSVPLDANAYEQNATVTVKGNTGNLVRTGYSFSGWNTAADGSGKAYAPAATFSVGTSNVVLYALWTQLQTYTVTYNGNNTTGGAVPTDAGTYQQGTTVTVKTNSGNLAKTGYTFAGWNTAADGTGTSYAAGSTFTMGNANVVLYAVWTQNPTYTVTYNDNNSTGGTVPTDAGAYQQGTTVTTKTNSGNLVKTGFTFAGWNTAADGTGTSYAAGTTFAMGNANVTLYAVWTQNPTYTVTYNGNSSTGGVAPVDAGAYQQGSTVTVKSNTGSLARTGYTFAGWNTAADGSGTPYAAGATFTIGNANVTLYAKWTIAILSVKFNTNGGSVVDSQLVAYNSLATAPAAPTKTGNVFAGWYSDQTLTSPFSFTAPIVASITLYAKWAPVYTVTYNGNGNTGGTAPADNGSYISGAIVTILDNTGSLVKTGYSFAGWNTNAAGTGTDRTPGNTFQIGSTSVILYAKWTINSYAVSFNSNGGSAVAVQNVNYGSTATPPNPAPTKTSYVFAGWYADSALTSVFNFATTITSAQTLWAKWQIQDADGNVYHEVKIGNQVWMVENLKTTKYNDGSVIPTLSYYLDWTSLATPAYCWYNDSISSYKTPYGALYDWFAVGTGKLAPLGWHVANDNDWTNLTNNLGGPDSAGGKMKEAGTAHWASPNTNATNSSGFTALPGDMTGGFGVGYGGNWWSSTQCSGNLTANCETLSSSSGSLSSFCLSPTVGVSVRCIRDY